MSESKHSESKEADNCSESKSSAAAPPTFTPLTIEVSPATAKLTDPLTFEMVYTLDAPVSSASWNLTYTVDSVSRRQIVVLSEGEAEEVLEGGEVRRRSESEARREA